MKSKLTTAILFFVLIIILGIIILFGGAMYIYLTDDESNQVVSILENIAIEEPENKTDNNIGVTNQSISESIQGISSNNSQESQTITIENDKSFINRYFYNQLIGNQKTIYDGLNNNKQNLKQGNYKIEFGDTFSEILSEESGSEQLGKDYQTAIEAFMHDNPDLFYIDVNKMYLNIETTTKFFKTSYNVYISSAQGKTYLSNDFLSTVQIENAISEIENVKNNILNKLERYRL